MPSVVHWKSNHYAAVIDEREGQYLVVDPTFGAERWLRKEVVHEEASGHFLIPTAKQDRSKFAELAPEEAAQVFGRGYAEAFCDDCDEPECPTTESEDGSPMNPGAPNGCVDPNIGNDCEDCPEAPSHGGSGGGCGQGMAIWHVSEPFISLWVTDTPVFYTMSTGQTKNFTLHYKQRNDRDDDHVFGVGKLWESSFLSYVAVPSGGGGSGSSVSLYVPGGGKRAYTANGTSREFQSRTTMSYASSEYTVEFPKGGENVYGYPQTLGTGDKRYFVTEKTDRYGRTTTFSYSIVSGSVHLTSITDPDGNTTTFTYGAGADVHRITGINAPYSRSATLAFNGSGELTSITDAENMSSSFGYSSGFLNSLTTPYGTTTFDLAVDKSIDPGNPDYNDNIVHRAIFATHPNSSRELWIYRNASDETYEGSGVDLLDGYDGDEVPDDDGIVLSDYNESGLDENNSFHWGPRQYALINSTFRSSEDFQDLTVTDYKRSHIRYWLIEDPSYAVTGTLNMERLPDDDGADWGQTIWYDYVGKSHEWFQGTQSFPRYVGKALPNGDTVYTRYDRRSDGQVTDIVEGWEDGSSSADDQKSWEYSYAANDLVQWIKGPDGNKIVEYSYNGDNQITTVKNYRDSSNYDTTTYTYDGQKRVEAIDSPPGLEKEISYLNSTNSWISGIDYNESNGTLIDSESFTYSGGEVRTHSDLRGLTRTFTVDDLSRITEIDFPDATDIEIEYDKMHVSRVRDRLDEWTSYGYNNMGWMTSVTNRLNDVTSYDYCDCGALENIENPEGAEIDFGYDGAGRQTTISYESGPTITRTYDDAWRLLSVGDGQGTVSYEYDEFQRLDTIKVNSSTVTTHEYDDYDRVSKSVHDGVETRYTYDPQYRIRTRTLERGANDRLEEWIYNSSGLYSYEFDETSSQSWTTTYARDDFGRATSVTRPVSSGVSQTTSFTYNAAGDLLTLTDPASHVTTWVYDTEGRMTQKWDHSSTKIEEYDWDANGWLEDRWTIGNGTTYFTFDDEGRLTNINYPSGTPDVSYTYDDAGRLFSMSDDIGTTLFRYTAAGLLDYEAGPWSTDTVDYGYTYGRRTSLSVDRPSTTDWSMSYSYDSSLRLDSLTSPAGTFDYVYSGAERRVDEIDLPGSLEIDYGYTANDKRLADSWLKYGVTTKNHHGYTYNVAGSRTEHELPTGVTATLDHDALGQLTDADDYNTYDFDYAYDDGWNLDYRKVDGVTEQFSVNNLNELTSSPLGSATYDSNGNLTDDGNSEYTYDHADRLTQAEWQDGADYWRESYSYDGLDRLREIYREHSTNGTTWTFSSEKRLVYDGRVVVQERDGSNNVLAHYTRGLDISGTLSGAGGIGGILAREWSSNTAFYHSDAGGNVTRLVDSSGNVKATYQYGPYGDLLSHSGTWASDNPYLFSGKRFLGDGLYYYGFRFYNSDLQRWINKDPIGETGGFNLYSFVSNDPIGSIDPDGLDRWVFSGLHSFTVVEVWDPQCKQVIGYRRIDFSLDHTVSAVATILATGSLYGPGRVAVRPVERPTGGRIWPSSCLADKFLLDWANLMADDPPPYSLPIHNCQHFTNTTKMLGIEETDQTDPQHPQKDNHGTFPPGAFDGYIIF